jgi:hypothetical protein
MSRWLHTGPRQQTPYAQDRAAAVRVLKTPRPY